EELVGGAGEDLGSVVYFVASAGYGLVLKSVAEPRAFPHQRGERFADAREGIRPVQVAADLLEQGAGTSRLLQGGPQRHLVGERLAPGIESHVDWADVWLQHMVH